MNTYTIQTMLDEIRKRTSNPAFWAGIIIGIFVVGILNALAI